MSDNQAIRYWPMDLITGSDTTLRIRKRLRRGRNGVISWDAPESSTRGVAVAYGASMQTESATLKKRKREAEDDGVDVRPRETPGSSGAFITAAAKDAVKIAPFGASFCGAIRNTEVPKKVSLAAGAHPHRFKIQTVKKCDTRTYMSKIQCRAGPGHPTAGLEWEIKLGDISHEASCLAMTDPHVLAVGFIDNRAAGSGSKWDYDYLRMGFDLNTILVRTSPAHFGAVNSQVDYFPGDKTYLPVEKVAQLGDFQDPADLRYFGLAILRPEREDGVPLSAAGYFQSHTGTRCWDRHRADVGGFWVGGIQSLAKSASPQACCEKFQHPYSRRGPYTHLSTLGQA
jgi:hypothetical protein